LIEENKKVALERSYLKSEQLKLQQELAQLAELKANAELGFAIEKQKALEEKREELDRLQAEALDKLSINAQRLAEKEKVLLEREENLRLKEAEALAGFTLQRQEILEQQQSEIEVLKITGFKRKSNKSKN
jgi:hypothetical protein